MKQCVCFLPVICIAFLFLISCKTTSPERRKLVRQFEKEERIIERQERKEVKRALKIHQKQKKEWVKLQSPEVQKRLKEDAKSTKKFYKPYGKAKTNVVPGEKKPRSKKYRKDGLKKR